MPIGNLTSQFFANLYLDKFDHYIKEELGCSYYLRYVDDFAIFSNNKKYLWEIKGKIEKYLAKHLRLKLHPLKTRIYQTKEGVDFLGFKIFTHKTKIRKVNVKRFIKRLKIMQKEYKHKKTTFNKIKQRINSWTGHSMWADAVKLREKIFENLIFVRS